MFSGPNIFCDPQFALGFYIYYRLFFTIPSFIFKNFENYLGIELNLDLKESRKSFRSFLYQNTLGEDVEVAE